MYLFSVERWPQWSYFGECTFIPFWIEKDKTTWTDFLRAGSWAKKLYEETTTEENGWQRMEQRKDIWQVSLDGRKRNQKINTWKKNGKTHKDKKMTKNTKTKIPKIKTKKSDRKALTKTLKPELSRIRLTLQNTKHLLLNFHCFSCTPYNVNSCFSFLLNYL